ncbi:MAG: virulence RhuM family protein [Fibrobacter sp.]|nr:virulence RhuM family protein [Fibrobacter sp.]
MRCLRRNCWKSACAFCKRKCILRNGSFGKKANSAFMEGELDSKVVCANFAHTTPHGAIKGKMQISEVVLYNLDVIISVGYRVKSIAGTRFRQWANHVLKDYMLKGYAVNQRKIATDLQIADRLHEQRQLIENQEEHGREVENYCFYTLFILYFVVVSTTRLLWRCQFCKSV